MNQLLEWLPLLIFFVVFKVRGIYWATAALMLACVGLAIAHRMRTGRYKSMHVVTAAVALVLGALTLLLHDQRFIQWKPTVLFGAAALVFLASSFVGRQPLARRMLEGAFGGESLAVEPRVWAVINALWTLWFATLAGLNIYVARHFSAAVWVNFHVFGVSIATLVFMLPQVFWLASRAKPVADGA